MRNALTAGKQLFSTLADGKLTIEVMETEFPEPTGNQVLVQMEAAPINPSDLAILTSSADLANAEYSAGKFVADMPEPFGAQKGVTIAPPSRKQGRRRCGRGG